MARVTQTLSEIQERRIARYLRDVGEHLRDLPSDERERALARLNARIERELKQFTGPLDDNQLDRILESCGAPANQAANIRGAKPPSRRSRLAWSDRVWLGVCGGIARRLNLDANIVRLLAVLAGLILPLLPLLLIAYVTAFLYFSYSSGARLDLIRPWRVLRITAGYGAVALALHLCSRFVLFFIAYAHVQLVGEVLVYGANWGWLVEEGGWMFTWTFFTTLPLAAMSVLPVSANWDQTLRKTVQAVLAVYAMLLCFGVACALVGAVLANVGSIPGTAGTDALFGLIR